VEQAELTKRLQDRFGDRILRTSSMFGQDAITIRGDAIRDVATFLRDDPDTAMVFLMDLAGVDYLEYGDYDAGSGEKGRSWRFEVVYHFYSLKQNHRYRVKVAVPEDALEVPSIWDLWRVANWMEREVFDLYGVRFSGHPNLRRILCHDEFVGHALRKDYPINRRQKLGKPTDYIIPDDPDWA
jgi:NADH/F420H2 dehydrogenase subunit C